MKRALIALGLLACCGVAAAAYHAHLVGEWPSLAVLAPRVEVTFDRDAVDFGTTPVGVTAVSSMVVTNLGSAAVELSVTGSGPFRPVFSRVELAPHSASVVALEFAPGEPGEFDGVLTVARGARTVGTLAAHGIGEGPPAIALAPRLLDFGAVSIGEELAARIQVRNEGDRELEVQRLGAAAPFYMDRASFRVAPQSSVALEVAFVPEEVGPQTARLLFQTNDPVRPTVAFEVTGRGIDEFLSPVIQATPSEVSFGRVAPGKTARRFVEIRNPSEDPLTIASVLVDGPFRTSPRSRTIPPRGFVRLPVTFAPTSEADRVRGKLSIFSNDPEVAEVVVELHGGAGSSSGSGAPGITVIGAAGEESGEQSSEARFLGTDATDVASRGPEAVDGGGTAASEAAEAGVAEEAAGSRVEEGSYVNLASFHEDIATPNIEAIDYNADAGTLTLRGVQLPTVGASLGEYFEFTPTDIVGHIDEAGEVTARVPVQLVDDRGDAVAMEFELTTDTASLVYDGVEVAFVGSPLDPAGSMTLVGAGIVPDGRLKGQYFTLQMNLNVKETSLAE